MNVTKPTAVGEASAILEFAWYRALWFEDQWGGVLQMTGEPQTQLVEHYERSNARNGYWLH